MNIVRLKSEISDIFENTIKVQSDSNTKDYKVSKNKMKCFDFYLINQVGGYDVRVTKYSSFS